MCYVLLIFYRFKRSFTLKIWIYRKKNCFGSVNSFFYCFKFGFFFGRNYASIYLMSIVCRTRVISKARKMLFHRNKSRIFVVEKEKLNTLTRHTTLWAVYTWFTVPSVGNVTNKTRDRPRRIGFHGSRKSHNGQAGVRVNHRRNCANRYGSHAS